MTKALSAKTSLLQIAALSIAILLIGHLTELAFAIDPAQTNVAEEIESTIFDLYVSDSLKGIILVRYTEEWFEIDDPHDLIDQLKEIKEVEKLLPILQGRIFKTRSDPAIGSVTYDLKTFRIILQLNPEYLPEKKISLLDRLPDPESNFSVLQNAGIASTGDNKSDQSAALNHRTVASLGKYFAVLDATAVKDSSYIFTEGAIGGIVGDYETSTGLLQTKGQTFANSVNILGGRIETSENIFLDRDKIRGSKFEVFIPSRSRVEFYRDERLLSVQVLDFGLQEVNTSQFPEGSYDIDIVIYEDGGGVSRERRFFTKSGYLAISSRPVFYIQAGGFRDQIDVYSLPVYQTGFRWRATTIAELKGSIYGNDDLQIGELETVGVYRDYLFGVSGSCSTQGDSGIASYTSGSLLGLTFNASMSQTLSGGLDVNEDDFETDDNGRRVLKVNRQYELVTPKRSTFSGTISKNFKDVTFSYSANRNKRKINKFLDDPEDEDGFRIENDNEDRYAYGPRFEWRIINDQRKILRFSTAYLDTDQGSKTTVGLSLRYNFDANLTYNSDLALRRETSGDESSFRNTFSFNDRQRSGLGTRLSYSNDLRSREDPEHDNFLTNQLIADHTNSYIRSNGFVRSVTESNDDTNAVGINAETAFVYTNDSGISVSNPPKEGAVLIADLDSKTSKEEFQLLIDGQPYATLESGKRSIIGLLPYRTYKISLKPKVGKELVDFDNKVYDITLFPGNVVRKTWSINKIVIVVGKLINKDGTPVSSQRIKGTKDYVVTEKDGTFQAELLGTEKLYIDSQTTKCKIDYKLPSDDQPVYVVDLGDVQCL